jgi:hypothetical protein
MSSLDGKSHLVLCNCHNRRLGEESNKVIYALEDSYISRLRFTKIDCILIRSSDFHSPDIRCSDSCNSPDHHFPTKWLLFFKLWLLPSGLLLPSALPSLRARRMTSARTPRTVFLCKLPVPLIITEEISNRYRQTLLPTA